MSSRSLVAVCLLLLLTVLQSGCPTAKRTLVGRWREANGAITEYTADGRVIAGPYTFKYSFIDEKHFEITLTGIPGAEDRTMTCSYTINGNQLVVRSTEMEGFAQLPRQLQGMHPATWVGPSRN